MLNTNIDRNNNFTDNKTSALIKENELMKTWLSALEIEKNNKNDIINNIKNNHNKDIDKLKFKLEQCQEQYIILTEQLDKNNNNLKLYEDEINDKNK